MPKSGSHVGAFLLHADFEINHLIDRFRPTTVIFESPILSPKTHIYTARKLMGLAGLTEMICQNWDIRCLEASAVEARKAFLGDSGGKRDEAKRRCVSMCRALGVIVENDDEADAVALLWLLAGKLKVDIGIAPGPLFKEGSYGS